MKFLIKLLIFSAILFGVKCLVFVPERANASYINRDYIANGTVNIRRYSRKSPYYMNLFGFINHEWNNNVTVDFVFSQFLHNEYRRSFVELHYKLCDLVNNEPFIGSMLKLAGARCPVHPGYHEYMNMTAQTMSFRNVFPFEKGRVDVTISETVSKKVMLRLFVEAKFTDKLD